MAADRLFGAVTLGPVDTMLVPTSRDVRCLMKLIHCWTTSAAIAAALILTASGPLAADELAAPSAGVDNPGLSDTDLRDFRVSLLGLFNSRRYADLDTLAQQLQQQRSRFKGGAWRLHIFFGTLSSPGSATATDAASIAIRSGRL